MTLRTITALFVLTAVAHAQFGITYKRSTVDAGVTPAMQTAAWQAYRASLHRICPRQRIELQTPAQLSLQLQTFRVTMSPPQATRYRQIAEQLCQPQENSAQCSNTAMLVTVNESRVLDRLVDNECSTGTVCTAVGHCQVRAHR